MGEPKGLNLSEISRAMFEGQFSSIVASLCQNELPPRGLAGALDWHFNGAISRAIQLGNITGRVGECSYFPQVKNQATYHLILLGTGASEGPGERNPIKTENLQILQKNLLSLRLSKVAVSKSDFGNVTQEFFNRNLKGISLWIAP